MSYNAVLVLILWFVDNLIVVLWRRELWGCSAPKERIWRTLIPPCLPSPSQGELVKAGMKLTDSSIVAQIRQLYWNILFLVLSLKCNELVWWSLMQCYFLSSKKKVWWTTKVIVIYICNTLHKVASTTLFRILKKNVSVFKCDVWIISFATDTFSCDIIPCNVLVDLLSQSNYVLQVILYLEIDTLL